MHINAVTINAITITTHTITVHAMTIYTIAIYAISIHTITTYAITIWEICHLDELVFGGKNAERAEAEPAQQEHQDPLVAPTCA